jgi:Cu-Zn family superoxide dismutase
MHPVRTAAILTLLLVASAGAIAAAQSGGGGGSGPAREATTLRDAQGRAVGRVELRQREGRVLVSVRARRLPPGFHGFHVHAVGECDAPSFAAAGGHLARRGQDHSAHVGDLPSLLVGEDGTARLTAETDRFTIAELRRGDGAAFMVHGGRDNFANIPDRYDPAPDEETRNTGDAGSRIACGVVD